MIRVVLADDHAIVRSGLERLLATADGIEVVGTAADGLEAVDLVGQTAPDVVLMDLSMPGFDGVDATRRIASEWPATKVLVLTSFSDERRILAAVDAGARGYLLKHVDPDALVDAIRAVHQGGSPLDPEVGRVVLDSHRSSPARTEITDREREVLALLRAGLANKEIARRLRISERTVKAHLTSVFQRLGVTDRVQAALWAREHLD